MKLVNPKCVAKTTLTKERAEPRHCMPHTHHRARRLIPTVLLCSVTSLYAGLAASAEREGDRAVAGFSSVVEFDDQWLKTVRTADAPRQESGFYGDMPTAMTGSLHWPFEDGQAEVGLTHIRDLLVTVELEVQSPTDDARQAFNLFRGLVMRTIAALVGPPEAADGNWDVAIWSDMLIIGGLPAPIASPPPELVWSWALLEAACGSLRLPLDRPDGTVERTWELPVSKPIGIKLRFNAKDVANADAKVFEARKECSATITYGEVVTYRP